MCVSGSSAPPKRRRDFFAARATPRTFPSVRVKSVTSRSDSRNGYVRRTIASDSFRGMDGERVTKLLGFSYQLSLRRLDGAKHAACCMMIRPRCNAVTRSACLVSVIVLSVAAVAEETVFRDVQFPGSKGKLTNATLRFSDQDKLVEARVSDGRVVTDMYSYIDTISYYYIKDHGVTL